MANYFTVNKTRFPELGYWQNTPGCWSVVDLTDGKPSQIGQKYPTKQALLGNLESFATEFGCALASPVVSLESVRDAVRSLPVTRYGDSIFIPLPVALWRLCDADGSGCICDVCKADGSRGYWDTLAVSRVAPGPGRNDFTWTVHNPALHDISIRRAKIAQDAAVKRG